MATRVPTYDGALIRVRRVQLGLTAAQLADRIRELTDGPCDRRQVEGWENNRHAPTPRRLGELAAALECTINDFYVWA